MKLSISVEALNRLIGGDSEIELQLRQQVVENFAKKYLKTLIDDSLIKRMSGQFYSYVHEKSEQLKLELVQKLNSTLSNTLEEDINTFILNKSKAIIDNFIHIYLLDIKEHIEEHVKTILPAQIEKVVYNEIQNRLKKYSECLLGENT
jgi:hypothetical protein